MRTVLRNAVLVDGTGADAKRADIVIDNRLVTAVEEPLSVERGDSVVIELGGATVAPGFIDVHSHADNSPFLAEDDTSKILQGVTTEVVGNCGFSLAPRRGETAALFERYALRLFPALPWEWHTVSELFGEMDERGYVTHYVPLVGHHALRVTVMGLDDRPATPSEVAGMGRLLDEALEAGVFGLSTGLIYPPGMFSETEELTGLVGMLPENLIYTTHIRGESSRLLKSLAEAVAVAEAAGRRLQISHLKVAGRNNWGTMGRALQLLDEARARGLDVRHDVYPYTAGSTMLTAVLPPWFQDGGDEAVLGRLHDPSSLERLRKDLAVDDGEWDNWVFGAGWSGIVVASSPSHEFDGMDLSTIADELGCEPFEALVEVLIEEKLRVSMIAHSMCEEDLFAALSHTATMIGSDGLPPGTGGRPHPRTFGTFPRVLARYVRDLGVLSLEEAVRRMTSLPAETFGLADRGVIEPGRVADLVVFDPDTVADRATYQLSHLPPAGISLVMQEGAVTVAEGRYLGRRNGRRLTPAPRR